uniref:Uncharacterized protein n=1 Tax=Physcomitrium patens TaxID=3218 RepID=A0A7I4ECA9_PHYPA
MCLILEELRGTFQIRNIVEVFTAMTNAVAMAGLCGTSTTTLLLGSPVNSDNALSGSSNTVESVCPNKFAAVVARAESSDDTPAMQSRRSILSLLAATFAGTAVVNEARADARSVKLEPPPPLSGGLPGTDNADQARDRLASAGEIFHPSAVPR